jgi:hypothetical protein
MFIRDKSGRRYAVLVERQVGSVVAGKSWLCSLYTDVLRITVEYFVTTDQSILITGTIVTCCCLRPRIAPGGRERGIASGETVKKLGERKEHRLGCFCKYCNNARRDDRVDKLGKHFGKHLGNYYR